MDLVLSAVLPIFALILGGYVCARRGLLGPEATDSLNRFVVWLALPALLFQVLAQARLGELGAWRFIAVFGGGMAAAFVLSLVLDRRPEARLADRSIEGLDAGYANTGFLGIPLALTLFGQAGVPAAVIATLLTVCVLFAVAIVLIEIDLQAAVNWAAIARKVGLSLLRNPLLMAPAAGVIWAATGWPLPSPVVRFTGLLGAAASPCALVTIGLFLAQRQEGGHRATVIRLVVLKLVGQPVLTAILAFWLLPMPPLWSHSALLLSALPTGTGPFMLAKFYNREAASTSQVILLSTLGSVITLSVLVVLFGRV